LGRVPFRFVLRLPGALLTGNIIATLRRHAKVTELCSKTRVNEDIPGFEVSFRRNKREP